MSHDMKIYQTEIADGLESKLKTNTIAYIVVPTIEIKDLAPILKAKSSIDNLPKDLLYIESILASTGWNKNDDIFDSNELFKARNTAANKKINYMHDEKDIIGHMVCSYAVNGQDEIIDEFSSLQTDYDSKFGGYLYKIWDSPELQDRMNTIISNIHNGKLFVSMECLFPNFDYGVIDEQGQMKTIARNEQTSFLTKHLRIYGGDGTYQGYRVGRLLRNFFFSGKGVVDNPANEGSIFTKINNISFKSEATLNVFKCESEKNMITQEELDNLKTELKEAKAAAKTAAEQAVAKEIDGYKAQITSVSDENKKLSNELAVAKEVISAHESNVSKLEASVKDLETKLANANEQIAQNEQEVLKAKRLSLFADVDVTPEKASSLVDKFITSSDEDFGEIVAAMPKKAKCEDKKDEKKDEKSCSKVLDSAEVETTIKTIPAQVNDTVEKSVANWFGDILKSNKKKGE